MTLSTVGYGDIAPASVLGRVVAVVLMVVGVGTFAALTATVSAYFVEADSGEQRTREIAAMREDARAPMAEVRRLLREHGADADA